jgi:sporulation protein YlmC with PRC-barrel domain
VNEPENRLRGRIDGALHLLDRQLIDADGKLLGKVDDVELTERAGALLVTGLQTGPAALLNRLGGGLGAAVVETWRALKVSEPNRTRPWRIDISDVDRLDSAVHLSVRRDGVLRRDRDARRLGQLTGMDVLEPGGRRIGRVLDARFEAGAAGLLEMRSLIVGNGRPGTLLGYDRRSAQGPWLVRVVVRRMHRHSVVADIATADIDWDDDLVRLRSLPTRAPDAALG